MTEPRRLGKYEILKEIGRGGFAVVYKARDTTLDRIVALKVLHPHITNDPAFIRRFQQEARAAANLSHPNIATVYEVGEQSGQHYLAMTFLVLCSLAGWGATEKPTPTPGPSHPQTRSIDDMVMVYVPGGVFQMGSTEDEIDNMFAQCNQEYGSSKCEKSWYEDESPQHPVTLDAFWIDQTEVTNAQYALCVTDGECTKTPYADDSDYNGDDYPIVGVSWNDAVNYCAWAGAQLPTKAQWEYAAKGTRGYIYPWGDTFDGTRVNFCDVNCTWSWKIIDYDDRYERTSPVASYRDGASWCDALDMVGNIYEWTVDWYGDYSSRAQTNPTGPAEGDSKVLRGGSFYNSPVHVRTSSRGDNSPTARDDDYGFRCLVAAPEQ